ncbi:MAG: fructose-6-phosphate aldolase [Hyphomicrobiales bacterium]|nr:fructose-6-phosphate aldolase [Hyphomicrobiales bacterium]
MKIFLDSTDIEYITRLRPTGMIDGITTNPSLMAQSDKGFEEVLRDICTLIEGPVSAEVVVTEAGEMYRQGRYLANLADNIVVKLPCTWEGMTACRKLADENIGVNVTLCFSANQALLAAKAGAMFISPFIGRIDDTGADGMELIEEIRSVYDNYGFETEILAASIRNVEHVKNAALIGADVATLPPKIFEALIEHPLTDKGLEKFLQDWKATGQNMPIP